MVQIKSLPTVKYFQAAPASHRVLVNIIAAYARQNLTACRASKIVLSEFSRRISSVPSVLRALLSVTDVVCSQAYITFGQRGQRFTAILNQMWRRHPVAKIEHTLAMYSAILRNLLPVFHIGLISYRIFAGLTISAPY